MTAPMPDPDARLCARCGRPMAPRRRWAARDAEVRWCSERCRRRRLGPRDRAIEAGIRELAAKRAPAGSLCPSEVARALGGKGWRSWLEPVREAARRLAASGEIEVTQRGRVVNAATARGPIRLRRARR